MKFTVVLIAALSVSSSWGVKVKKTEDPKDKREASVGYPSLSSHSYQAPALGHDDGSSISIGAGYSVGGAKPTYSLGGHDDGAQYQLSGENLSASGHGAIQLAPITLQGGHGLQSSDLSQLMAQLSHGLNTGAITLQTGESYQQGAHGGNQELSLPQYTLGSPKLQQYALAEQPSVPNYAAGTKGLGSYSTGPVLFNPADAHGNTQALTYGAPSASHTLGGASNAGHSFANLPSSGQLYTSVPASGQLYANAPSAGHAFLNGPSSGHLLGGLSSGGHSFGEGAISHGGSGYSFPSLSLGSGGHSFGGPIKGLNAGYGAPTKTSFKPSAFLGSSLQSESGHGLSSLSGSYGAPSFGGFSGGSHGLSHAAPEHGSSLGGSFGGGFGGGSNKFIAPSYLPSKSAGFGSSLESLASFSTDGHLASPPGTTYGVPSASYGAPSNSAHAASNASPQYYPFMKHHGFGGSSSSYRAPSSGHSSLSSLSSGPKHGFGYGSPSSRYSAAKDTHGAHSENTYNTIKYSEEFKPRGN